MERAPLLHTHTHTHTRTHTHTQRGYDTLSTADGRAHAGASGGTRGNGSVNPLNPFAEASPENVNPLRPSSNPFAAVEGHTATPGEGHTATTGAPLFANPHGDGDGDAGDGADARWVGAGDGPDGYVPFGDGAMGFQLDARSRVASSGLRKRKLRMVDAAQELKGEGAKADSYNYAPFESAITHAHAHARTHTWTFWMRTAGRWLLNFFIAATVALVGAGITYANKHLIQLKFSIVEDLIGRETSGALPSGSALAAFVAVSTAYATAASFPVALFARESAGSGIPEVKAILNGVCLPGVLRARTLVAKVIGNVLAVSSGMAIGREGPMIHCAAIIATGTATGCGVPLRCCRRAFASYRTDKEMRDFVACGTAAGVAAAFGAPIGGVLLAIEEGASHWHRALVWRIFFCAVVTTYITNILLSVVSDDSRWGSLSASGMFSFGDFTSTGQTAHNWSLWELPFFLSLGIAGGVAGAGFSAAQRWLARIRARFIPASKPGYRMMEVMALALVTAVLLFTLSLVPNQCRKTPDPGPNTPYVDELERFYCDSGYYNQLASMFMVPSEDAIRQLFHFPHAFSVPDLALFFAIYAALATLSFGVAVPSGSIIPALLAGSALGRIVGELLHVHLKQMIEVDAGVYALMGAAAVLGGVTRMTISLAVILLECTGNYQFGLPLMGTLLVARFVGNAINDGIYEMGIDVRGWPVLHDHPAHHIAHDLSVYDVMSKPPVVLQEIETVETILRVLRETQHNGFPVVFSTGMMAAHPRLGSLAGLIQRRQLMVLLARRAFHTDLPTMPFGNVMDEANGATVAAYTVSTAGVHVHRHDRTDDVAWRGTGTDILPTSAILPVTVRTPPQRESSVASAIARSPGLSPQQGGTARSPGLASQSGPSGAGSAEGPLAPARALTRLSPAADTSTAMIPSAHSHVRRSTPARWSTPPAISLTIAARPSPAPSTASGVSASRAAASPAPGQRRPSTVRILASLAGLDQAQPKVLLRMPSVTCVHVDGMPPAAAPPTHPAGRPSASASARSASPAHPGGADAGPGSIDAAVIASHILDLGAANVDTGVGSHLPAASATERVPLASSESALAAVPDARMAEATLQFVAEDDILKLLYTDEPLLQQDDFEQPVPELSTLRFSDDELQKHVDLRPYFHATPHTTHVHAPIARAFEQFRMLGLRHLVAVNDCHDVVGILTRHDLVDEHLQACRDAKLARRKLEPSGNVVEAVE